MFALRCPPSPLHLKRSERNPLSSFRNLFPPQCNHFRWWLCRDCLLWNISRICLLLPALPLPPAAATSLDYILVPLCQAHWQRSVSQVIPCPPDCCSQTSLSSCHPDSNPDSVTALLSTYCLPGRFCLFLRHCFCKLTFPPDLASSPSLPNCIFQAHTPSPS